MKNLLIVNASPNPDQSVTRGLTARFFEAWTQNVADGIVTFRDIGLNPPPHLDQDTIGAFYTPAEQRSTEQKLAVSLSDTLMNEVRAADVIVIGAPMHNFGSPSSLKAWFDHVSRVGETFRYTENGPVGLLSGKKIYILTARGGNYAEGSPAAAMDMQEPYLRTIFGFLGLNDITFIHSQGLVGGGEVRSAAIQAAADAIDHAVNTLAA